MGGQTDRGSQAIREKMHGHRLQPFLSVCFVRDFDVSPSGSRRAFDIVIASPHAYLLTTLSYLSQYEALWRCARIAGSAK